MDFLKLMQTRYTTKYYNPDKKIPQDIFAKILECARLAPSAVNIQPWKFIVLDSQETRQKLLEAVPDFNQQRYLGADKVVLLCARNKIDASHIEALTKKMVIDGRCNEERAAIDVEHSASYAKGREAIESTIAWTGKQIYIALTTFLYAAASYGVDSTPIEGIDIKKIDKLLNLEEKGLNCMCAVFLGYRADNDSNTLDKRAKTRLTLEDIVETL